jgi:hypothetical protein
LLQQADIIKYAAAANKINEGVFFIGLNFFMINKCYEIIVLKLLKINIYLTRRKKIKIVASKTII